jgi:hypothetical protein
MKSINHFPVFILLIFFQSAFSKSVQDYSGIVFNAQTNNPNEACAKLYAESKEKPWSQLLVMLGI